jgi:hypothetical protein
MDIVRQVKLLPGINYRELAGVPGHYFDCGRMRAVLTPEACASNFLGSAILGEGATPVATAAPSAMGMPGKLAGKILHPTAVGAAAAADLRGNRASSAGRSASPATTARRRPSCNGMGAARCRWASWPSGRAGPLWASCQSQKPTTPREIVRPLAGSRAVLSATPGLYQAGPGRIMLTALVEGRRAAAGHPAAPPGCGRPSLWR